MNTAGDLLRFWRGQRRLSQADLADAAEVSPRHLSCLESGKARPSREMVLVLASALEVPLRERNTWLLAAGFAPAYRETDLDDPALAPVRAAVDAILRGVEPNGAVVVDRLWEVRALNASFALVCGWLLGGPPPARWNLVEAMFSPEALRPFLVNWEAIARFVLHRLDREARTDGDPALAALHERLLASPGVDPTWGRADWRRAGELLLPVEIEKDGTRLRLFTTITTLGTPVDVTLSELRIESYFPADDATRAVLDMLRRAVE